MMSELVRTMAVTSGASRLNTFSRICAISAASAFLSRIVVSDGSWMAAGGTCAGIRVSGSDGLVVGRVLAGIAMKGGRVARLVDAPGCMVPAIPIGMEGRTETFDRLKISVLSAFHFQLRTSMPPG